MTNPWKVIKAVTPAKADSDTITFSLEAGLKD